MNVFDENARQIAPPPSEPVGTRRTALGTVKWYKADKGYGAIASAATAPWDIWFHFSMLHSKGIATNPSVDAQVEVVFTRANQESFKYVAESVRVLEA